MGRLISTTGGRDVFLEDNDPKLQQLVASGDYKVAPGETVSIVDPYGHQSVVDSGVVDRDAARGVADTVESQDVVTKRAREKRLEGETSTLGALGRSALGAASAGLTDNLFDDETLEADRLHHGTASLIGEGLGIAGSLLANPEGRLLSLFGKGATAAKISEEARALATASDALTAEHVASTLSSNALLAGKGTANAGEKALARTGRVLDEATVTRQGLTDIPQDLIGMDAKGLKQAAVDERAALKAQADAEKLGLEDARKPMREQLANEVKDLHLAMETEAPIFKAVKGADVQAIEGIKTASAQLAKSYSGLRSTLDNPLRIIENTDLLKGPLQMRQAALEAIQAKAPELRAVLGNDARAAALYHVDDALEMTRSQIAKIGELSKSTPVASEKLAALSAGVSPRLTAIEAAQEALKQAPELGLVAKGARGAVFAGVSELARAIPGVGAMAPFVGKWASESVGHLFEHLGAGAKAVGENSKAALGAFLDVTKKNPATALGAGVRTASSVLRNARFAPGDDAESSGTDLGALFKARSAEIRSQTMYDPTGRSVIRPEKRIEIAKRLEPIGMVNPILADHLESIAVRGAEHIAQTMPRRPEVGGLQIGPDDWKPSDLEIRSWARTIRAVEDPDSVEADLAKGIMTPEAAVAYRTVYQERFATMQRAIYAAAPTLSKTLPLKRKIALSIFTGVPLIPALQPNILQVLQGTYRTEPGTAGGTQAQAAQPHFGALGSLKSADKPTPAQARENA